MLNDRQTRFVHEYCIDFNATRAAIRAGYSEKTARQIASELLSKPDIRAAIEERKAELAAKAALDASWVLRQWRDIAFADPNDLMQLQRVCCRYCWGVNHDFQWTEGEYRVTVDRAIDGGQPVPDGIGGFGFDRTRAPHNDCPECHGQGLETVYFADTNNLTGPARRLYAGVKKTKDGIEIKTRDQDAALANIARYLGMIVDRKELSGPNGGPVPLANLTSADLTDDQLASLIAGGAR